MRAKLTPERWSRKWEQQIRVRAYYKWQEAGCPHGRDVEFWLAGEEEQVRYWNHFWGSLEDPVLPEYGGKLNGRD